MHLMFADKNPSIGRSGGCEEESPGGKSGMIRSGRSVPADGSAMRAVYIASARRLSREVIYSNYFCKNSVKN